MEKKKVVRIEFRYEDGSMDYADGEAADKIADWYEACETLNCLHGAAYTGPKLIHVPAPEGTISD